MSGKEANPNDETKILPVKLQHVFLESCAQLRCAFCMDARIVNAGHVDDALQEIQDFRNRHAGCSLKKLDAKQ